LIKSKIITNKETYIIKFVTDEEILGLSNDHEQTWFSQQLIKLNFYKLNVCNFYIVFDSDCYFIRNFKILDFMYDENTPYTVLSKMRGNISEDNPHIIVKKYFGRNGYAYNYGPVPVVLSKKILEFFSNFLKSRNITFADLIKITPFEFQWCGEFLYNLKEKPFKIIPIDTFFIPFYIEQDYLKFRKINTVNDIIEQGYLGITMQAGWVKELIYKPSIFRPIYKFFDKLMYEIYRREDNPNINFFKKCELVIRRVIRDPIIEILRGKNAKNS
jgi:hypothetical protein